MNYIHRYDGGNQEDYVETFRERPLNLLEIDGEEAGRMVETVTEFYREHLESSGMDGYVVGLSGGVDSSTAAYLLANAVGPERVHGMVMPASHTDERDVEDALAVAEKLGITTNEPGEFRGMIEEAVEVLESLGEESEEQRLKRGNILARLRMTVLRDVARARNYLVAGTTNASERDLGYMTLAADGKGGVDNEALYDIYKTTERELASELEVPRKIVEKTPSADLWEGQEDRDELGFSYTVLDQVLAGLKLELDAEEISGAVDETGIEEVREIRDRVEKYSFKRELAPHPSF